MAAKRINQKDIARKLNVSPATVSLVLNDPDTSRASQETKRRILEMASSVSHHPSQANTILMLTEESIIRFHYGNSMLSGAQARAVELGLKFEMVTPRQNLSQILATRRVRGMIVSSWRLLHPSSKQQLVLPERVITVNIERRAPFIGIAVMSDHYEGMYQAVEKLHEAGHRRIAFLGYEYEKHNTQYSRSKERIVIFNEALEACGLDPMEHIVHLIRDAQQESIDRTEDIVAFFHQYKEKKRPTAIIAFNDLLAMKLLHVALREGFKVPDELSIIGIDNEPICADAVPAITSISPGFNRMGRVAVNIINDDNIWIADDRPSRVVIPSNLVERESIAPAPKPIARTA